MFVQASRSSILRAAALVTVLLTQGTFAAEPATLNALIDNVLRTHVKDGYVDYPAIARNVRFHKYVEALAEVDLGALGGEEEAIAFWLNAHNALAIRMVTDGTTPVDALGRLKFFRTTEHRVGGREYDLEDIQTLLAEFGDPRLHFAMVSAAYAGPDLRAGAYRADQLGQQLDEAVRAFVNDKRKNRFLLTLRRAKLSELFERHAEDFGDSDKAVLAWIAPYVAEPEAAKALVKGGFEIEYMEWDWSINGRPM